MFYLIGLGIKKEHITEEIKKAILSSDLVLIENYTSFFEDFDWLLEFLKKNNVNFIIANRKEVEEKIFEFIKDKKTVSLLIFGDPLFATTHHSILIDLREKGIPFKVVHNVSVLNLISRTGLSPYKFGKIISIPFLIRDKRINLETPIKTIKENDSINAHTLLLLDLDPINNDFLKAEEALDYLFNKGIKENLIVCSRLNWNDEKIILIKELNEKTIKKIAELNLKPPLCIIRFNNLNLIEEEFINKMLKKV